jgi:peptide/nickel transport system permease protein
VQEAVPQRSGVALTRLRASSSVIINRDDRRFAPVVTLTSILVRLGNALVVMALVALLTFLLIDLAPGSYLEDLATNPQVSAEAVERMRVQFGLDQPFYQKFLRWGRSVAGGDFGYSFVYQRPIGQLIAERLSNTVLLNVIALTAAWTLGLALGLAAAASRGSPIDWAIGAVTTILLASPGVVLAVLLLAGAARVGLPIGGLSGGDESVGTVQRLLDLARHLIVPATAIALVWFPAIARHTRAALIAALEAPYVLGARSRGVGRWRLLLVHALREALAPVSTLFGLSLSAVLSASLVVEVVMAWPGIGQLAYDAVFKRDIFLVVDLAQLSAVLLLVGNAIGDVFLRRLDPRVVEA